jgi:hypothetical protein
MKENNGLYRMKGIFVFYLCLGFVFFLSGSNCSPTVSPCVECPLEGEKERVVEEAGQHEESERDTAEAVEAIVEESFQEPRREPQPEPIVERLPEPPPKEKEYHPPVFTGLLGVREVMGLSAKEEEDLIIDATAEDFEGKPVPIYVSALPLGASWDQKKQRFLYRPTFIEAGRGVGDRVIFRADDGRSTTERLLYLGASERIRTPEPQIVGQEIRSDHALLRVEQVTDAFLDSPGHAGRRFSALLSIPRNPVSGRRYPIRIVLHGFDGSLALEGDDKAFHLAPHDPENTYWWGYADSLPAKPPAAGAVVRPYTARRVLALLEWVLERYPHADPERVYLVGASMGGAGAKTIGLLYARHFCYVEATIGQAIPQNHRASRVQQLASLWGEPSLGLLDDTGMPVWERLDLTRVLRESREAQNQFVFTKHSKDDPIIHFGAAVQDSPLTGLSWYEALQFFRVGHYAVWDEGGHGTPDPILGDFWSDWGWHRIHDPTTFFRRRLAFPAFSRSSADHQAGTGKARDQRPWNPEKGYAGDPAIPQDTGWDGDIAGAYNRHLRWDATAIEDEPTHFRIPLRVFQGQGEPPPRAGYPTRGNLYTGNLPVVVDVTLRRLQRFVLFPHQEVSWSFGALQGTLKTDEMGAITIPRLPLLTTWQTLSVTKAP